MLAGQDDGLFRIYKKSENKYLLFIKMIKLLFWLWEEL